MKKSMYAVLLISSLVSGSVLAQEAASPVAAKGKMLVSSNGSRLGSVYRVGPDGSAQVIVDGKMVTVPASTLSVVDGKLTTSLSKNEVIVLR